MPIVCAVIGCTNRHATIRIPKVVTNQGPEAQDLSERRRREWIRQIGREDITFTSATYQRICKIHFVTGAAAAQWNQHHPDWIPTLHMGHDRKKPAVGGRRADVQGCSSDEETHPEEPAAASHSSSIQMSPASTRSKTQKRRVISTEGIKRGRKKVIRQDQSDEGVINVGREIARWCQLAEELGVISNEAVAGILLDLYYAQRSPAYSDDGEAVSNPLAFQRPVALYKVAARSSPRSSIADMATEAAECNGTAEQHDMTALAEVKIEIDVAQDPLLLGQHNTQHHQLNRPVKEEPGSENTASSLQTEDTSPAPQVSSTYLDVRVKQEAADYE